MPLNFRWPTLVVGLLLLLFPSSALSAEKKTRAIGFSNLIVRIKGDDEIGVANQDYRVALIEAMRDAGLHAVGAESLVFGKDRTAEAELMLGGTVTEVECAPVRGLASCRLAILWEVLDVRRDEVVYSVVTRSVAVEFSESKSHAVPKALVLGSLKSLLKRPRFSKVLEKTEAKSAQKSHPKAEFAACPAEPQAMPAGADAALDATVMVDLGEEGHGSGFFLNAEGLVLTAAHVVAGRNFVQVRTRLGDELDATVQRVSKDQDVALLSVEKKGAKCLQGASQPPKAGVELYALGAPASKELGFSLSKGVVGGFRKFRGESFIQTDAAVNPGNSGGPLVDGEGRVAAVASWKVVGGSMEGLAFGVPIQDALSALGLEEGKTTAAALTVAKNPWIPPPNKEAAFVDQPDPVPSFDPAGDQEREQQRQQKEADEKQRQADILEGKRYISERRKRRKELTPKAVPILSGAGLAAIALGATGAIISSLSYDVETSTQPEFKKARALNDISWIVMGAGAVSVGASLVIVGGVNRRLDQELGEKPRVSLHWGAAGPGGTF